MNPLFNSLFGTKHGQEQASQVQAGNGNGQNWNALMGQLQANPSDTLKNAGYNVPQELNGNPQAMVQHLIQTGQISNPLMQRIMPMIQRMGVR